MNARSCSIVEAMLGCYCCNIGTSDGDRGDENSSSSSEVSSYEEAWFSLSEKIIATLD